MEGLGVIQQNQKSKCQLRYAYVLFCSAEGRNGSHTWRPASIFGLYSCLPGGSAAIGGKTVQLPSVISLIRSGNKSGAESRICSMGLQAS